MALDLECSLGSKLAHCRYEAAPIFWIDHDGFGVCLGHGWFELNHQLAGCKPIFSDEGHLGEGNLCGPETLAFTKLSGIQFQSVEEQGKDARQKNHDPAC